MKSGIYSRAQGLARRYGTRDPFEIMRGMGVEVVFSEAYAPDGLKGYCTVINRIRYAVINAKLSPDDLPVVGAHELGHVALHSGVLRIGTLSDYDIYAAPGKLEREANFFAADLRMSDDEVIDLIGSAGSDFFRVAGLLRVPAPFLAFKLYSMVERGFALRLPVDPDSGFMNAQKARPK